jgi:hypothetical protein
MSKVFASVERGEEESLVEDVGEDSAVDVGEGALVIV